MSKLQFKWFINKQHELTDSLTVAALIANYTIVKTELR